MALGDFTEQDKFEPVYCRRCHCHTPRAARDNSGLCPPCVLLAKAEEIAARAADEEARRQQEAARQARAEELATQAPPVASSVQPVASSVLMALSGQRRVRGICPVCGSHNIVEWSTGGGSTGARETAFCIGCCVVAWPLLLLVPFLPARRPVQYHRRCEACGHAWLV